MIMSIIGRISKNLNEQNKKRLLSYLKRNGFSATYYKVIEKLAGEKAETSYHHLSVKTAADEGERSRQRETAFPHTYRISLVVPAYETNAVFLDQMLHSVIHQTYTDWELCIADGSKTDTVQNVVMEAIGSCGDPLIGGKIKYQRLRENKGIAGNTNAALTMATGDYIGFLDHDDILTEDALYEVMRALNETAYRSGNIIQNTTWMLYSDEDKVNEDMSRYFDYHSKPDFDIDLLRSNNYICHFLVVRRDVVEKTGGFLKEYDGAQDHDFIFRCAELMDPAHIRHISKVLYHWRAHDISTALSPDNKLYAYEAGKRAIEDHLKRMNLKARVMYTEHLGFFRVRYEAKGLRFVSMTPGELGLYTADMLKDIPADAIMVMDNNHVKPINKDYPDELLGHMAREEVGAVGGKILSKEGRIDNAGFSADENGKLKPRFRGMNGHFSGYMHRASIQNRVDALDQNCVMIRKKALIDWLTEQGTEYPVPENGVIKMPKPYICVYDPFAKFRRI